MDVYLGFDTSCYTTSAAGVNDRGEVVAFSRMLLPVDSGQRGLRQSEAVFAHVRQMPKVMEALCRELPGESRIACVCASVKPRDERDSYMPVFTVGEGHGRVLAEGLNVPFYGTSHQQGHIAAGLIGLPPMDERFVALHISGGTTELLLWERGRLECIGGSLDLHAGQMVDRIGVRLGLGFPAGPALERLALHNREETAALLSASMEREDRFCHFSGAETKALAMIDSGAYSRERIAAETYDLLARTVARLLAAGCRSYQARQALAVGGVASSELLRGLVRKRLAKMATAPEVRFGNPRYCADNAAGTALLGLAQYRARDDAKEGL